MSSETSPGSAESYSPQQALLGAKLPDGTAPKYHRLASFLLQSFVEKSHPHTPLPTERELQEQFGVSRDTVRRAVSVLQQKGLVYNVQGSGTYISDHQKQVKQPRITTFSEDMVARGFTPSTATLGAHRVIATGPVATQLEVEEGTALIEVVRLHRADGEPMCFEKARFLSEAFDDMHPDTNISLKAQLSRSGFSIERVIETVSAINLNYEESAALAVPANAAGFKVERIGYTTKGRAVESTISIYRADRYSYEFELLY